MLIFQSGAVIPLQKQRAQRAKRTKRKLGRNKQQTKLTKKTFLVLFQGTLQSPLRSTHILYVSSAAIFRLSSEAEVGVTFKSRDFCASSFIRIHLLNQFPLHFVELTFYRYTNFSTSLKRNNFLSIFRDFPLRFFHS